MTISISEPFKRRLVDEGFSARFGARPLRRAVQRLVEDSLAECMLDGFAGEGDVITLDLAGGGDVVVRNAQGRCV